jgi:hypothetical protein
LTVFGSTQQPQLFSHLRDVQGKEGTSDCK